MARAALQLQAAARDEDFDLRVPVVTALVELYGAAPDDELVGLLAVMLPIEAAELAVTARSDRSA